MIHVDDTPEPVYSLVLPPRAAGLKSHGRSYGTICEDPHALSNSTVFNEFASHDVQSQFYLAAAS